MTPHFTRRPSTLRFFGFFLATLTVVVTMTSVSRTVHAGQRSAAPVPSVLGSWSFLPAVTYDSGGQFTTSLAVADLNGDGKLDVVVAHDDNCNAPCDGTVGVLLGDGDGAFQPVVTYDSGGVGASSVTIGDVNGDGKPDLVVANQRTCTAGTSACSQGLVGVLLGNGNGTFQPVLTYSSGAQGAMSVAIADVNGDGVPDLVTANEGCCVDGVIGVLLGNGDGTFRSVVTYPAGYVPLSVTIADLNGDGKPDLVVGNAFCSDTNCAKGSVGVLLGNGDGSFQEEMSYSSGGWELISATTADLNGDGVPDIVTANAARGESRGGPEGPAVVGVLIGNGDGTFQPPVSYASGGFYAESVAVADVNGDGKPDLVVGNCQGTAGCGGEAGVVGVLLGNGDGTFQRALKYPSGGEFAVPVAVGDLDGDGRPDLVVANNSEDGADGSVGVLLNNVSHWTRTALATSGSPSLVGRPVTFTVAVSSTDGAIIPNGGLVTFADGTTPLGSAALAGGIAKYTTSSLSAKRHVIKATYAGNAALKLSEGTVVQEVDKNATTTALTSSPNPSAYGQAVTFTALVASAGASRPTGRVTFTDGTTTIGSAAVSGGVATFKKPKLAVGSHSITARYDSDAVSATSTSAVLIQVVN